MNMQANVAAGPRRVNMGILFTTRKLPSFYSESVPRNMEKTQHIQLHRKKMAFENIVSQVENAGYQHFLYFLKMFSILSKTVTIILAKFYLSFAKY